MSDLTSSKYVEYLPRIYQKGYEESDTEYFLGRFLKAFEQTLTGIPEEAAETVGIEALIDKMEQYFDPAQAPAQFLPWLAGWVGMELEEGVEFYGEEDNAQKSAAVSQILPLNSTRSSINRSMIEKMVQLYKKRGTLEGLMEYLQIYAGEETTIAIDEFEEAARIGSLGSIGVNTMVGYSRPCFFSVHVLIPAHSRSILESKVKTIRKVIEKEKPFYDNYILNIEVPSMRVGVYARVGRETLLGGMVEE
jgi:phage tail-like protein